MTKCKACNKPIKFIKTSEGKFMPCDPELIYVNDENHGKFTLVMDNGNVIAKCGSGRSGYVSHFATCPQAEMFRK